MLYDLTFRGYARLANANSARVTHARSDIGRATARCPAIIYVQRFSHQLNHSSVTRHLLNNAKKRTQFLNRFARLLFQSYLFRTNWIIGYGNSHYDVVAFVHSRKRDRVYEYIFKVVKWLHVHMRTHTFVLSHSMRFTVRVRWWYTMIMGKPRYWKLHCVGWKPNWYWILMSPVKHKCKNFYRYYWTFFPVCALHALRNFMRVSPPSENSRIFSLGIPRKF